MRILRNMEELLYKKDVLDLVKDDAYFVNETNNLITFPIEEILKRMWNCRGKETTSIDKVKMEMIIKDVLKEYSPTMKRNRAFKGINTTK